MNKRGMQHVEFVVAFVLFAGFLLFALYFFSPFKGNRIVDSTLFYTLDEISSNASVDIESFSVSLNDVQSSVVGIPIARNGVGVRVEDFNGSRLESGTSQGYVYVDRGDEEFLVIMFSEDFGNSNVAGTKLSESNYSISSSDKRKALSELRLLKLAEIYNSEDGYKGLKKSFHLSEKANFGFSLTFSENDIITAQKEVPAGLEVFSSSERYEVIRDNDDSVEFGDLRVVVW